MAQTTLNTVEEFYIWAEKQLADASRESQRYGFRTWWGHEDVVAPDGGKFQVGSYTDWSGQEQPEYLTARVVRYYLTYKAGYDSYTREVELPRAVGEALDGVWKQNEYHTYVGTRNVAGIIKALGNGLLAAALVRRGKAAQERAAANTAIRRRNAIRAEAARKAADLQAYLEKWAAEFGADAGAARFLTLSEVASMAGQLETEL